LSRQSTPADLSTADFEFELPQELIAQAPAARRDQSRLLQVLETALIDRVFTDLETLVEPDELLVFNDTRVIKARLFGRKPTGGRVELLIERVVTSNGVTSNVGPSNSAPTRAWALIRANHAPKPGTQFVLDAPREATAAPCVATVRGRHSEFFELEFEEDVYAVLDRLGHVPLPPYIGHPDSREDLSRYQTIYARAPGAVAAPTAGLHFSEALLARLQARGARFAFITLHVGAGTFQPVRVERIDDHVMHSERYVIDAAAAARINAARAEGRRVTAVGTTTLRALEAAANGGRVAAGAGETRLFITPGYRFQIVDRLLTNFHLPRSTLLMLVSAFAGMERIRAAYRHAVERRYRFFSYGDAMLLERAR
jgi:S-adenosylmethionine:tRNA ribosyltransferase-isomerase